MLEEGIILDTRNTEDLDIEFSIDVEMDNKTGQQYPAMYCFDISSKESSLHKGYFVMTTRKYEVNPTTFATNVSNEVFLTNEDGITILTPSENGLSANSVNTGKVCKKDRNTFNRITGSASSCFDQVQLTQVYDFINTLDNAQLDD